MPGSCWFAPDIGHPPIDYTARVCNSERRDRGPPTRAKPDMPVDRERAIELIGVLFVLVRMWCFFLLLIHHKKQWTVLITQRFLFLFKSAASAAAEVCRGSMPLSDDSVQESVISQREGTLQCAVIFLFCSCSVFTHRRHRERREREGGRASQVGRVLVSPRAPVISSLSLSLSLSLTHH